MLSRKVSRVDLSSAYEKGILTKKSSVRKLEIMDPQLRGKVEGLWESMPYDHDVLDRRDVMEKALLFS